MDSPFSPPASNQPGTTCGQLGLRGRNREIADLISRSEVLAASGDQTALHGTAERVLRILERHIDDERAQLGKLDATQRGRLLAAQEALLELGTCFAAHPTADAGANLLALLVRQADIEQAAFQTDQEPTANSAGADQLYFTTDWAIAPLLVGSP